MYKRQGIYCLGAPKTHQKSLPHEATQPTHYPHKGAILSVLVLPFLQPLIQYAPWRSTSFQLCMGYFCDLCAGMGLVIESFGCKQYFFTGSHSILTKYQRSFQSLWPIQYLWLIHLFLSWKLVVLLPSQTSSS